MKIDQTTSKYVQKIASDEFILLHSYSLDCIYVCADNSLNYGTVLR